MNTWKALPLLTLLVGCIGGSSVAWADTNPGEKNTEEEAFVEIDVEDIVTEALATKASVQEAPYIISVITDEQMERQGYLDLQDAIQYIPGFYNTGGVYGLDLTKVVSAYGEQKGHKVLIDGVNVNEVLSGRITLLDRYDIEMYKRIETVSSPGGVLWGPQSYAAIVSIASKTADDIDGIEASASYGTGSRPNSFRSYIMGGTKLFGGKLKLFSHVSFKTSQYSLDFPMNLITRQTYPAPTGPATYALDYTAVSKRSYLVNLSGNAQYGPFSFHYHVPIGELYDYSNLGGSVFRPSHGEDSIDCSNPANKAICGQRMDPGRNSRATAFYMLMDRYASLRYRESFLNRKLNVNALTYWVNFLYKFDPYHAAPASSAVPGGVRINTSSSYGNRIGLNLDTSLTLPWTSRLQVGGEVYFESMDENLPTLYTFAPGVMEKVPIKCTSYDNPRECPVVNWEYHDRVGAGIFVNGQKKIFDNLSVDAGLRYQLITGETITGEPNVNHSLTTSGGIVWSFLPGWYTKVYYSEGFRPPSFVDMYGNGEAFSIQGNPELKVEKSRALMGEINASLLEDYGIFDKVFVRFDYSYSWFNDGILVKNGIFSNIGETGVHKVEQMTKLNLKSGHRFLFGYTFVKRDNNFWGTERGLPNQWFAAQGFINLWKRKAFFTTNIKWIASSEVATRTGEEAGTVFTGKVDENGIPVAEPLYNSEISDVAAERLPPQILWNIGVKYKMPSLGMQISADMYNILGAKNYWFSTNLNMTSASDFILHPKEGRMFMVKLTYKN